MPVDKFGRTDSDSTQRIVSGGVTLSQANRTFLRRDGSSTMNGDLNMNGKSIRELSNTPILRNDEAVSWAKAVSLVIDATTNNSQIPSSDRHLTNKKYVDERIVAQYVTATPTMTSNETTINGFTYVTSASEYHTGDTVAFEPWKAFQNTNCYPMSWIIDATANVWIQMKYPIPSSMSGFYIIIVHNRSDSSVTSWKVQASNDENIFTDITTPNTFISDDLVLNKFTPPPSGNYSYWRFHIISSGNLEEEAGIAMLQWIPTFSSNQASKCHVGYVPRLTSNISFCGFDLKASSEYTNNRAFNAFKGEGHGGEWISNIHSNFWLKIECPTPVRIWKVGLRGRIKKIPKEYTIEGLKEVMSKGSLLVCIRRLI